MMLPKPTKPTTLNLLSKTRVRHVYCIRHVSKSTNLKSTFLWLSGTVWETGTIKQNRLFQIDFSCFFSESPNQN
jgi:hypothetical protein